MGKPTKANVANQQWLWSLSELLQAGVNLNLSEVQRGLKKEYKKYNYFWNTTRHLISTQEHSKLSGDCFGGHLLIFKTNQIFNISYSSKVY